MLPILGVAAFALSSVLLFDLFAGARRSEETQQEQWTRAMSALSTPLPTPLPRQGERRADTHGPAAAEDEASPAGQYDLAA